MRCTRTSSSDIYALLLSYFVDNKIDLIQKEEQRFIFVDKSPYLVEVNVRNLWLANTPNYAFSDTANWIL